MPKLLAIDADALGQSALFPVGCAAHTETSLALLGDWHPLFQVLSGEVAANKGAISVTGEDARSLVISGALGVMPLQFEWPEAYTVEQLLELSARLLSFPAKQSSVEAQRVLTVLDLTALRKQRLSRLLPLQRRLVLLAHALLGSPRCLALEDPLFGLTSHDCMTLLNALGVARQGRSLIVSVKHAAEGSVERLLVESCSEVLVFEHGAVTLQGPPSRLADRHGLFMMTWVAASADLAGTAAHSALAARGVVLRSMTPLPIGVLGLGTGQTGARLVVELAAGESTLPLFDAAKSCGASLLELHALHNVE